MLSTAICHAYTAHYLQSFTRGDSKEAGRETTGAKCSRC